MKNYFSGFFYGKVGRGSSVGIATCYRLDGPGIESQWGSRFSAPFLAGPGAHPASCRMGTVAFPGVKRPGRGVNHPSRSSADDVKERVELYLYSPSEAFMACSGVNFTLPSVWEKKKGNFYSLY
jgi:hypothetical protein